LITTKELFLSNITTLATAMLFATGIAHGAETKQAEKIDSSPLFKTSPLDSYFDYKQGIHDKTGFTWGLNYSMMQLQRTDETKDKTATGQLDLIASMDVFSGRGKFAFFYMDIQQLAGISNPEFSKRNGNITPITDSDEVSFLRQMWYSHNFLDDRFRILAGKTEPLFFFGGNRFASNDRTMFQAVPLAAVAAKDRTTSSPGILIQGEPLPWLSVGMSNNELTPTENSPDYRYYAVFNVTFKVDVPGLGEGNYRFNSVFTEEEGDNPETNGLIFSFDQDFGQSWSAFLRYDDTEIQTLTSALNESRSFGIYNRSPFGRTKDNFGLGVFRTKSDQGGSFTETGLEAFYRMAITDSIDLSFTVQQIDPAKADEKFVTTGMRLFLRF
jgi:carbohydrate-selective porin OprB